MADVPNILIFVMESQRVSNLSVYGYEKHTTPHLEALAAEGLVYERHRATSPWCLPSYASMHTGKYPSSHGATIRFECLATEFATLSEVLARHHYVTAAFSSNSFMSDVVGLDRGYQHLEFFKTGKQEDEDKGAAEMERRVKQWLAGVPADRPFFLFINSNEPHWPYWAPEPYRFLFLPQGGQYDPQYLQALSTRAQARPDMAEKPVSEEEWGLIRALYDGETARADGALGAVIDALRASGRLDRTLVAVTSDHGEEQGEHIGFLAHAYGLYGTLLDIPLVLRLPGRIPAGRRYSGLTQPVDLFPTALTLSNLDEEEWHWGLQGVNLCPTFEPGCPPVRERAIAEYFAPLQRLERDLRHHPLPSRFERRHFRSLKSIEDGRHKFIWSSDGQDELYDLEADPGERKNLIDSQPGKAMELYRQLDHWLMSQVQRDYGDALNVHPMKGVRADHLHRLEAWGLMRRIHELPFGSGKYLSETIGR
ncbi:MAG: sulfatase [Planctomycetes bacterium]|nr:sulfatase [Planctomycetota bacterium]